MTAFIALAVLGLALFYVYQLSRHFSLGFASLLGVEFFRETFGTSPRLLVGFHIDPVDVVWIFLLAAGVIRSIPTLRSFNIARLLAFGYVALFAFSCARGLYANGLATPLNEMRGYMAMVLGMVYFLTAPTDEKSVRRYVWMYLIFGAALCLVAALAAAGLPVGLSAMAETGTEISEGRYLPATGGAAIALCGFLSLAWLQYRRRSLFFRAMPLAFMAVAIYLRHRTIWMMLLAGTLAMLLVDGRLFRRLMPYALASLAVIASLAIYGAGFEGAASVAQFEDSATNGHTWEWRVNGWKDLLFDDDQTALTVIVGKTMGSGYYRVDMFTHRAITVHPHSEYVNEYLRVGVVGSVFAILFTFLPFFKFWRLTREDPLLVYPSTSAWAVVVVAVVAYGVPYDFDTHFFALIGIANAILMNAFVPEQVTSVEEVEQGEEWNILPLPSTSD